MRGSSVTVALDVRVDAIGQGHRGAFAPALDRHDAPSDQAWCMTSSKCRTGSL